MPGQPIDETVFPELREWFAYNCSVGCDLDELGQTLLEAGYLPGDVTRFVDAEFSRWSRLRATGGVDADPVRDADEAVARLWRRVEVLNVFNEIEVGDRTVRLLAKSPAHAIHFIPDFLSDEECEALIEEGGRCLGDSMIVDENHGGTLLTTERSSQTGMMPRGATPLARRLENRIARLTDLPVTHGEGLQIVRYGVGGEYRPHFDFFDPQTMGGAEVLARGGQRLATVIMYLSDVEAGGGTRFPELGLEFTPLRGAALLFASVGRDGALLRGSLHWGRPVTSGEKWIATKWIRVAPH